ncbi:MAG: hypothetical protein AAF378_18180 [Cyanobacteria bacterium P01_A01_bin.84]
MINYKITDLGDKFTEEIEAHSYKQAVEKLKEKLLSRECQLKKIDLKIEGPEGVTFFAELKLTYETNFFEVEYSY